MKYRRALSLLLLFILAISLAIFVVFRKEIDAPEWATAVATVIIVGGVVLGVLPNLHDSTEFIQNLFSRHRQAGARRNIEAYAANLPSLQRNRANLLANIYKTWVEDALHNSLHSQIIMTLGMTVDPTAVGRPVIERQLTLIESDTNEEILVPTEKHIAQLFVEHGRSLLILGDPGSGKTITLLQLAEALVADAQSDSTAPIPVVLNLSSWAADQFPLAQWIGDEMFVQYGVPPALTLSWLADDQLVLLLDGLDEVANHARNNCITTINQFRRSYSAEVAVCSRVADYERLSERLNLSTALRIKPLGLLQMHTYLNRFGDAVRGFRNAIDYDANTRTLAQSPLVLSLVPITYANVDASQITRPSTVEAGRHALFNRYIRQMFRRRPLPVSYTPRRALTWLHNLASGMKEHSESVFYIERLQPTWLPTTSAQQTFRQTFRLIFGLINGLVFGSTVGLIIGQINGQVNGLIVGLIIGLIIGLLVVLVIDSTDAGSIELAEHLVLRLESRRFIQSFATGFVAGFIPIASIGIVTEYSLGVSGLMLTSVAVTLAFALVLLPMWRLLNWQIGELIVGLIFGSLAALIVGPLAALIFGLNFGLTGGLINGLSLGLIAGTGYWLIFEGLQGREAQSRSAPNQSIHRSTINVIGFLSVPTIGGLIFGLILWALDGRLGPMTNNAYFALGGGLRGGLTVGITFGTVMGAGLSFLFGLQTIIQHYLLRYLINRHNLLPAFFRDRTLITYLDTMAERIFLQRVGGGWRFIHRFFLEYVASLTPEEIADIVAQVEEPSSV